MLNMARCDLRHVVLVASILIATSASANLLDTEPQTRNSPLVATPEAVKLEPFSGSAVYSYKFEVPPGTGGLTPDLVLTYSTLTRGTEYGWGWSLNLSRVERSTRFGPPSYNDTEDEFELDGDLLVKDPTLSNRFHKLRTDFSRIQYFPGSGSSTSYWEMTRPDGLRLRYGSSQAANSRLTNGNGLAGQTFKWLLDEVVDARGNSYRIEYRCDPSSTSDSCSGVVANVYPSRIRYSFRSSTETPSGANKRTLRLVTLDWEPRGYGSEDRDRPTSFRPGFKTQVSFRLAGVRVGIDSDGDGALEGADQVRRYRMTYTPKFSGTSVTTRSNPPFSQLESIQRYGSADAAGSDAAFPSAVRFAYNRPQRGFAPIGSEHTVWTPPANGPEGGAIRFSFNDTDTTGGLWDMDGDGLLDRVKTRPNSGGRDWKVNYALRLSDGRFGYGEAFDWGWCSSAGQIDCPTTIPTGESGSDKLVNVGQSSEADPVWTYIRDDLVDMDGDSLPDRISVSDSGTWTFRRNLGGRFGRAQPWDRPNLTTGNTDIDSGEIPKARYINSTKKTSAGSSGSWETRSRLIDINGDGRPDHVAASPNNLSKVWVSYNLGCESGGECGFSSTPDEVSGRLKEPGSLARRTRGSPQYDYENVLDMNADGLPDLVYRRNTNIENRDANCLEVGFGNGSGFQSYTSTGYVGGASDCRIDADDVGWVTRDLSVDDGATTNHPITYGATLDLNGDGVVDRIGCTIVFPLFSCIPRVALGLGDGTFSRDDLSWFFPNDYVRLGDNVTIDTIDLDGDGLVESVKSSSECSNCPSSQYTWEIWDNLASVTGPEWLLSSVQNEFGGLTSIEYESSARSLLNAAETKARAYAPETLSPSTTMAPHHTWVVKSIVQSDGRMGSPAQLQTLEYAEPRYDYELREMRGFRMAESTDAANTVTRSIYHQSLERRGLVEYQEVEADGQALRSHETTFAVETPRNETGAQIVGSSFASPVFERSSAHSGSNRRDHSFVRVFESTFGNLQQEFDLGADGVLFSQDDLLTVSEFSSVDTASWLIRIPSARYRQFPGSGGGGRINDESFEYSAGLLTRRTVHRSDPVLGSSETLIDNWERDSFGNVTKYWPPSRAAGGNPQSLTTWDSEFNTFPVAVIRDDGAGLVLQTSYAPNPALGEVAKRLDPMGHLECWTFDRFGRLTERRDLSTPTTSIAAACDTKRVGYTHSDAVLGLPDVQHILTKDYSWPPAPTGPEKSIESYVYFDGLGRVYREAKQASSADFFVTARAYGSRGELTCESEPARVGAAGIGAAQCGSAAGPSRLTAYDALLRPTQRFTRLGSAGDRLQHTTSYAVSQHDGSPGLELVETQTVIGAPSPNLVREIGMDARDNVVSVREIGGGLTTLRRDPAGRITAIDGPDVLTVGGGTDENLMLLRYNSEGQRVSVSRPSSLSTPGSGPTTTYSYDADGNLAQIVPARGAAYAISLGYDGLSRLIFKDVAPSNSPSSPGPTDSVYQYDASTFGVYPGKLGRVSTGGVATELQYDFRGRTLKKRTLVGSATHEASYGYDLLDRVTTTTYPDRSNIARVYDGSLLVSLHELPASINNSYKLTNNSTSQYFTDGKLIDQIAFHDSGSLESLHFTHGGLSTVHTFDPNDYRLTRSTTAAGTGTPLDQLNYSYDTAGNAIAVFDSAGLFGEAYAYDSLHRLSIAFATGTYAYSPGLGFSYDDAGNLRQKGDLTLGYGGASGGGAHAVTSATSASGLFAAYIYDLDGNVSGKGVGTGLGSLEYSNFTHDAQNRLTGWTYSKTTGETGSAAYAYDDSGARVTRIATKTGLAPESVTTVDPEYEVDHNRQRTRAHLFVAGARVATLERQAPAPASGAASPVLRELHYHADRLGTPRLITDATGAVVQRTFPKPFGELWKVVDGAGSDIAPSSRASQHLFTGQHADVESDLHYFGARTYDPLVGRFLEVDPELVGSSEGITFGRIAGAPQNLDGYGYASNNPTNRIDANGRADADLDPCGLYGCMTAGSPPATILELLGQRLGNFATLNGFSTDQQLREWNYLAERAFQAGPDEARDFFASNPLPVVEGIKEIVGLAAGGGSGGAGLRAAAAGSARVASREISLIGGYYQAEGSAFRFSRYYYEKLWQTGRGAPFLQAEEVLATARTVTPDIRPGYFRYANDQLEMVYNPSTGDVWHLQPMK